LTFTDYIRKENIQAKRFEQLTPETINFIQEVERVAGAPVSLISTGFNWKIDVSVEKHFVSG
jgi:adenylosuccinate synthase